MPRAAAGGSSLGRVSYPNELRVDSLRDTRPCVRMRLYLERDRLAGVPWRHQRFSELVTAAVRDVRGRDGDERADWLSVLYEQSRMWKHAYERTSTLGETPARAGSHRGPGRLTRAGSPANLVRAPDPRADLPDWRARLPVRFGRDSAILGQIGLK